MASLSNTKIKDTYQSLVKFNDNGNITTSPKRLTDGFGNVSPFYVSTTQIGIGTSPNTSYDLHVYGNTKIGANLDVSGNLTVNGTLTYLNVTDLEVDDPLIQLAVNNTANILDIGLFGKYAVSTNVKYKGFFNDASDDKFKLFTGLTTKPLTTVDTSDSGYTVATLVANLEGNVTGDLINCVFPDDVVKLTTEQTLTNKTLTSPTITGTGAIAGAFTGNITGNLTGNVLTTAADNTVSTVLNSNIGSDDAATFTGDVTGTISSLSNHDTDDLIEGTTNLYFTTTRARDSFTEGTGVTITDGEIAIGQAVATDSDVTFGDIDGSAISGTTGSFSDTITSTKDGIALQMDGGASAEGIRMQPNGSGTYPVFLRSINPSGSGEASPWLYQENSPQWGIWHNNPTNSFDFTRSGSMTGAIATDVGGETNSVMIRLNNTDGSGTFVGNISGAAISGNTGTFSSNIRTEKLSLGTTDTDALIDVEGTGSSSERGIKITSTTTTGFSEIQLQSDDEQFRVGVGGSAVNTTFRDKFYIYSATAGEAVITVDESKNTVFYGSVTGIAPTSDLNFATKKYVDDSIVGTPALSAVLAVGNTSGSNNLIIQDNDELILGSGTDFKAYHNETNTLFRINTGDLIFNSFVDDGDIKFNLDNGADPSSLTEYMRLDGGLVSTVFSKPTIYTNNTKASFGSSSLLSIDCDGSNGQILQNTGDLYITNSANDKSIIFQSDNGIGGVTDYFKIDGNINRNVITVTTQIGDNTPFIFGAGAGRPSIKYDSTASQLFISGSTNLLSAVNFAGLISSSYSGTGTHVLQNASSNDTVLRLDCTGDNSSLYLQGDHIFASGVLVIGNASNGANLYRATQHTFQEGTVTFDDDVYLNYDQNIYFNRNGTSDDYSNIIGAINYPTNGYNNADQNFWIKAQSKGGFHIVLNSDGTNTSAENAFDDFVIFQGEHDGTPRFRVSNIGTGFFNQRLGVGTVGVTPYGTMEVGKPLATDTMLTLSSLYSGANGGPTLNFRSGHGSNTNVWNMAQILVTDDSNYNGRIEFKTTNAGGGNSNPQVEPTTKMVLKSDGSLGINITNLTAGGFTPKLALKQTTNSAWGGINVESAIDDSVLALGNAASRHIIGGSYRTTAGYKPLDFLIGGSTQMTLDVSGNLDVFNGNGTFGGNITAKIGSFRALAATASIINNFADSNGNNCATFRTTTPGQIFEIRSQNNGTLKFDTTSSYFTGDVGIGKSVPDAPLVVYRTGDVWHTIIGNDSGQFRIGGQTGGGAVIQSRTQSGTDRDLYIQRDGGRVGIGVNSTPYKLTVADTTNNWMARFENVNSENVAVFLSHASGYGMAIDSSENDSKYLLKLAGGTGGGNGRGSQIRMLVESSGKVGIGNSSPDNQLTVKGANCIIDAQSTGDSQTIGFRAGYLNNADLCGFFRYTTADAQLYIDNNFNGNNGVYSDINFRNKANGGTSLINRMKIKGSTGYVGLANESPLRLFDARGLGMFNGPTTSSNGSYIYDGYVDSSSAYLHEPTVMIRTDSTRTGGIDEAPASLAIFNISGGDNTMTKLSFASRETAGAGNTVTVAGLVARKTAGINGNWASGELSLFTKSGSGFSEGMIMDSAGRSVFYNTTKHKEGIRLDRQGSTATGISWYNDTYYNWQNYMASAGAGGCGPNANLTAPTGLSSVTSWALRSRMEGVSTYGWIWETGGSGGGGATASAKMELGATNGTLRVTGDLVAYASDKRLKTNVKNISNPIEKIKQINGVEYDWVDDIKEKYDFHPNSMHEVGVLAQEIEKVLPEAVLTAPMNAPYKEKTGEDHNFLTVKYERIVPLLIEAIKEQQKQIDKLTKNMCNCKK